MKKSEPKTRTRLGEYLDRRSVNKSEISRKSGISNPRITELSINPKTKLTARELYLIAMAMDVNPCEMLDYVCEPYKLKS